MNGMPSKEELLQQWRQTTEQGIKAWLEALGRTPQPDIYQYWRPFFDQGMVLLRQMMAQGATPEILQLWKQALDQGIEAWSKALEEAMATEGFAAALGKYLDQYLSAVGPAQKDLKQNSEAYLRTIGLPSRTQIAEMASQLFWLESRIEALEAKIEKVLAGLASLEAAFKKAGSGGKEERPEGS
ncbi:MAG: hypothetical protein ACK4Z6_06915 [Candidatus Methylomirabilales bacterium]